MTKKQLQALNDYVPIFESTRVLNMEEALSLFRKNIPDSLISDEDFNLGRILIPIFCETEDPFDVDFVTYIDKKRNITSKGTPVGYILCSDSIPINNKNGYKMSLFKDIEFFV